MDMLESCWCSCVLGEWGGGSIAQLPLALGSQPVGKEDGCAQGFLLLGHPSVPSSLLKGAEAPFLVLGHGLQWRGNSLICEGAEPWDWLEGGDAAVEVQGQAEGYRGGS